MTRVAFVVNGGFDHAMGHRARAFASRLGESCDVRVAYRSRRKVLGIMSLFAFLLKVRPHVTYVLDMAYSGVIAGVAYRLIARNRYRLFGLRETCWVPSREDADRLI